MSTITTHEIELRSYLTNENYLNSIESIRLTVEKIWADDAPRIIKDYTDHGINHCKRIAGFLVKLLNANDGRKLSEVELYILILSTYLHDIGMQCDISKYPEIFQIAQKFGADFNKKFDVTLANGYTIDEQNSIRKNHHLLTAAWIDYAFKSGKTILGSSIKSIPSALISDLIDICKHHSKLPITNCPLAFKSHPVERKQLLAALLRFADELDIDSTRVNLETIKTYSLDPKNGVYWWLHNNTSISFNTRNFISINVRLNPSDIEQHEEIIYSGIILEFQTKNKPVLSILAKNGIPIVINDDSKIISDEYIERFPSDISFILNNLKVKKDPLWELTNEISMWLKAIRYEVGEPRIVSDRIMEITATLAQGAFKQGILIRCIDGEIKPGDIDELDKYLTRTLPQGWLISDKRVSPYARDKALENGSILTLNLSDFLKQMIWAPYIDFLDSLVKRSRIPEYYIDIACYKEESEDSDLETKRQLFDSLDKYLDTWLKERGKMHISMLGDFGSGKTWACRHYAYRQMERYLSDPTNERLPLLITLRSFAKAMTTQQLINEALLENYKLPFLGSAFDIFQEMNKRGKILLILDGFDEMAKQVDYQTVVDNFWQLATLVDENSKVILTSRTEYFRWAKESEKILSGQEFGRRTILLSPPKFEVLYLNPLSDSQIKQIIINRLGNDRGIKVSQTILTKPNLAEMARKPVLVELLLAALDDVSDNILENSAQVYLYSTNKLLLRNIDTQRTFTTTADKLFFLCELAWEMIKSNQLSIHFSSIPEKIKTYFGEKIKDQHELDTWDFDLRNQTLLHRNAAGYYEFAHKSLAEFFVAYKFANELDLLASNIKNTYCEADGSPCALSHTPKSLNELVETFGSIAMTDPQIRPIRDFLPFLLNETASTKLWQLVELTKGQNFNSTKFIGGNAITLLKDINVPFSGRDLSRTVLNGADLSRISISNADFSESDLSQCNLQNSHFLEQNMIGAKFCNTLITVLCSTDKKNIIRVGKNSKKEIKTIPILELIKDKFDFSIYLTKVIQKDKVNYIEILCSINNMPFQSEINIFLKAHKEILTFDIYDIEIKKNPLLNLKKNEVKTITMWDWPTHVTHIESLVSNFDLTHN